MCASVEEPGYCTAYSLSLFLVLYLVAYTVHIPYTASSTGSAFTFLDRRLCVNYAVLIASALLFVNMSPVYIIVFERPNHAVAAVVVENMLFVLDQKIPPIELEDYFSYVLQNTTRISFTVFELMIESGHVVYKLLKGSRKHCIFIFVSFQQSIGL